MYGEPTSNLTVDVTELLNPTTNEASSSGSTSVSLTWTKWKSKNVLILRKKSTETWTAPIQGESYTVGSKLGDYTMVVYNGIGTEFDDTGLLPGVTYDYKFFTENGSYYSSGVEDQTTTNIEITFDSNGGNGTMNKQSIPYNTSETINDNAYTRIGFIFSGWNTASDGSGTSYSNESNITLTENITLYAQWTAIPVISSVISSIPTSSSTQTYKGATITISGSTLSGITTVKLGGSEGTVITDPTITSNSIEFLVPDGLSGGTVFISDGTTNLTSSESFSNLGYITSMNGEWSDTGTWLGDAIPASGSKVTIANNVIIDQDVTVSAALIESGKTLTVNQSKTLQTGGAITNNGTFNVNGTLQINANGSVGVNSPVYGSASTLKYNTGGTYGRYLEWNSLANIIISNSTTLNYTNGDDDFDSSLSESLTIDAGSALYMDYGAGSSTGSMSVAGNVTINGNLSLGDGIGGDLYVGGNLNFGSSATYVDHGRAVFFNGTSEQIINLGKDVTMAYVFVEPNAKVTLASGNTLTITNFTINNSGTFLNDGILNTSSVNVNQTLGDNRNWWYLSSPLSAASSSIFGTDKVGKYIEDYENDENALTTAPYYTSPFGTAENLTPGRGYVVKRASTTEATYTFTGGNLNNGDVSATVTRTGTTAAKRGFNLVGNPYPSYINWDLVYDAASTQNLSNAIWFRTKSGSEMAFHTYSDGDGVPDVANSKIAPMQAFWVKAENSPAALTFKNTHRMHFESGYNPLKVKAADNRQRLRLVISNGQTKDEALIVGKSYASNTLDNYDVEKMSNGDVTIPELYSLVQNDELVINSLNQLKEGASVQLGVRPGQAGNYTLEVSQFENIDDKVVLKDKLTNTETELTAGSVYSFTSDANATNDRFVVEFRAPGITTAVTEATEGNTQVFVTETNRIAVQLLAGKDASLSVYNMAGQLVAEAQSTGTLTVLDQSFSSGVYLVKVNNLLSKVVIK